MTRLLPRFSQSLQRRRGLSWQDLQHGSSGCGACEVVAGAPLVGRIGHIGKGTSMSRRSDTSATTDEEEDDEEEDEEDEMDGDADEGEFDSDDDSSEEDDGDVVDGSDIQVGVADVEDSDTGGGGGARAPTPDESSSSDEEEEEDGDLAVANGIIPGDGDGPVDGEGEGAGEEDAEFDSPTLNSMAYLVDQLKVCVDPVVQTTLCLRLAYLCEAEEDRIMAETYEFYQPDAAALDKHVDELVSVLESDLPELVVKLLKEEHTDQARLVAILRLGSKIMSFVQEEAELTELMPRIAQYMESPDLATRAFATACMSGCLHRSTMGSVTPACTGAVFARLLSLEAELDAVSGMTDMIRIHPLTSSGGCAVVPASEASTLQVTMSATGRLRHVLNAEERVAMADVRTDDMMPELLGIVGQEAFAPLRSCETHVTRRRLALQYLDYCCSLLGKVGDYRSRISPAFDPRCLDLIKRLLQRFAPGQPFGTDGLGIRFNVLYCTSSMLAHKRFATGFVRTGGLSLLVAHSNPLPASSHLQRSIGLCLYTLASSASIIEEMCRVDRGIIEQLVSAAVHIIAQPAAQDSVVGLCLCFFALAFNGFPFVDLFEKCGGLSAVCPIIDAEHRERTVELAVVLLRSFVSARLIEAAASIENVAPGPVTTGRVSSALHVFAQLQGNRSLPVVDVNRDTVMHALAVMETHMKVGIPRLQRAWAGVAESGVVGRLLDIIEDHSMTADPSNEVAAMSFGTEVLWLLCLVPAFQRQILEYKDDNTMSGIAVLFRGVNTGSARTAVASLRALAYLAGPVHERTCPLLTGVASAAQANVGQRSGCKCPLLCEDLNVVIKHIRACRGLRILFDALDDPPFGGEFTAEESRALVCQVCLGLCRDAEVTQMLQAMGLPELLSSIVGAGKSVAVAEELYTTFTERALELISIMSGRAVSLAMLRKEASNTFNSKLTNRVLVKETATNYSQRELLGIIAEHLVKLGLTQSASCLVAEARLSRSLLGEASPMSPVPVFGSPPPPAGSLKRGLSVDPASASRPSKIARTPGISADDSALRRPLSVKLTRRKEPGTPNASLTPMRRLSMSTPSQSALTPDTVRPPQPLDQLPPTTLHNIIVHHLRKQHEDCLHPMSVLPMLSLRQKHVCPDVRPPKAPGNMLVRRMHEQLGLHARYGGPSARQATRHYIHSRLRAIGTLAPYDDGVYSAAFLRSEELVVGGREGLSIVNPLTGDTKMVFTTPNVHVESVTTDAAHRMILAGGMLSFQLYRAEEPAPVWRATGDMLPCAAFRPHWPQCLTLREQEQDVVSAIIHDLETGREMTTWSDIRLNMLVNASPLQLCGRGWPCFRSCGNLFLVADRLYDVRAPNCLHQFDQLQSSSAGSVAFHPSTTDIVFHDAVWDGRTFKLRKVVPGLAERLFVFNSTGDVMYTYPDTDTASASQLVVMDGATYTELTNVDLSGGNIGRLTMDPTELYMAITEGIEEPGGVRVFEIGRKRISETESDGEGGDAADAYDGADVSDDDDDDDDDDEDGLGVEGVEFDDGDFDDNMMFELVA